MCPPDSEQFSIKKVGIVSSEDNITKIKSVIVVSIQRLQWRIIKAETIPA